MRANEFINEGRYDPAIFKVIFIIGGPGSGKSYVTRKLGLQALGYVNINSDIAFEYLMKKHNISPKMPPHETEKREVIRQRAKDITSDKSSLAIDGRLGIVVDGTGDDYDKISRLKTNFDQLGYNNFLVVVNTKLDVARNRNQQRKRTVPDDIVVDSWYAVQNNIGKFAQIFENIAIIDNSGDDKDTNSQILDVYKKLVKFTKQEPNKPAAKRWIQQELDEASYPGNVGIMELMKFQKIATPEEKAKMKLLLATDKKAAWDLLQSVVGTELHALTEGQPLYEIDMSPSNLRKLAANTGAIAGMEFEMAMPNVESTDEAEMEPDFNSDDRVSSFDGIEDFFADLEYNTRNEARRLVERIRDEYYEWAQEKNYELWEDERDDFFRDEMKDEFDFDEAKESAAEELEKDPDSDEVAERVQEMFDEFVEEQWDDQGRLYQRAQEKWLEDADMPDETDFFSDRGLRWMSDIYNEYAGDINWPYYTYINAGEVSLNTIGEEFSQVVDKPVNVSTTYHGAKRSPTEYSLEPDSSINADEGGAGLEFITPPMPIDELLADLQKTIKWAKSKGAYTNSSTGLHMNISIPDKNMTYLDFSKLALLLGDQYVLADFGREANRYAESALGKIKSKVKSNPELATKMMDEMRKGMNALASRAIANTDGFGKYTSINPKGGYVEFRSPGGDWLNEDIGKLTNTLLRFIVALDAALDPEKYRKEYLKKLYQILQPKSNDDPIAYFAQYSAGLLPKSALKSFIRQAQLQRSGPQGKYWWKIKYGNSSIELVASSEQEAKNKARVEWNLPTSSASDGELEATPIRPYEEPSNTGNYKYEVYAVTDPQTVVGTFYGRQGDRESARAGFRSLLSRLGINNPAGYGYRVSGIY